MALLVLSLRRAASSIGRGGGTCTARGAPPACPPCEPAPPPPCRARHPPGRRGTRVVCCAPAPGARPPCAQPAPAPPLTCRDVADQNCVSPSPPTCLPGVQPSVNPPNGWVCDQDPVALRLQVARSERRAHYEWEVACRAAAPPPPSCCPALYVLGRERECARATDGCTYAVLPETAAPSARCGPCRTPPPPRCVELAPDDACRIRGDVHLDPCAHRPRIMIQIDRSESQSTCPAPCPAPGRAPYPAPGPAACPAPCPTPGSAPYPAPYPAPCPAPGPPPCPPPCPAPDPAPCRAPGLVACPAPPRCRPITIIERLRAHVPGCQSERHTHTSSALSTTKKSSESVSGGLEGMFRSKEQLKEAGLGRFVTDVGAGPASSDKPTCGRVELSVPPGTERVAVHVSLSRAAASPPPATCATSNAPSSSSACDNFEPTSERRNPCLSINQIRKKWTGQYDQKLPSTQCKGDRYAGTRSPARCPTTPSCSPGTPLSGPSTTPCGSALPPRCKPGAASTKPSNEPKTKTKQCSSTSAFMANTIVAYS